MEKNSFAVQYAQNLMRAKARADAVQARTQADKDAAYVPLVDQIRTVLVTLPPTQVERLSLAVLLPHLKGKYRPAANHVKVAQALRQLGYESRRSWKRADRNTRVWIKSTYPL